MTTPIFYLQPLTAAILIAISTPIFANNSQQKTTELAPIVVTAQAANDANGLIVHADPKQAIQPIPAVDGAAYLQNIMGFNQVKNGGANSDVTFRGMFGSRIKIVTDGTETLGACPSRMDSPTSYISPESYDRITVVKGPQTVQYAHTGSAATVSFEREPEQFENGKNYRGQASVLFGSYGRLDQNIEAAIGDEQKYARLNTSRSVSDNYQDGHGNTVPSKWEKWNADLALGWTPNENTWVELKGGKSDGEAAYAGRSMDGSQFARESLGLHLRKQNVTEVIKEVQAQIDYSYNDHIMDNYSLRSLPKMNHGANKPMPHGNMGSASNGSAMHQAPAMNHGQNSNSMNMSGMDHSQGSNNMDMSDMDHDSMHPMPPKMEHGSGHGGAMSMQVTRRTLNSRASMKTEWDKLSMISGVDIQRNKHAGQMSMGAETPPLFTNMAFESYGAFTELNYQFNDANKIVSGVRFDQTKIDEFNKDGTANQRKETLPSGFIRLENDMTEHGLKSYVGVGYVERVPDYWELFSTTYAKPNVTAFDGLKNEKTAQLDIGTQFEHGAFSAWASGYAGLINDFILMTYIDKKANSRNVDATIAGAEAGIAYQFNDAIQADVSTMYAWGKNTTNNTALPQIAPLEGRVNLRYVQDKYNLGLLWRVVASQDRISKNEGNIVGFDTGKSSSFNVLAINATYNLTSGVDLSVGIDNLLDQNYAEHLNKLGNAGVGLAADQQFNNIGRNYWARMSMKF